VGSRTEKHLAFAFAAEYKVAAHNETSAREAKAERYPTLGWHFRVVLSHAYFRMFLCKKALQFRRDIIS
jgi:hypothetical protein